MVNSTEEVCPQPVEGQGRRADSSVQDHSDIWGSSPVGKARIRHLNRLWEVRVARRLLGRELKPTPVDEMPEPDRRYWANFLDAVRVFDRDGLPLRVWDRELLARNFGVGLKSDPGSACGGAK